MLLQTVVTSLTNNLLLVATFDDKTVKHVVVLIAMEAEGRPLIDALQLQLIPNKNTVAHCHVYQGNYHGGLVSVVLNGKDNRYEVDSVGTTPGKFNLFEGTLSQFIFNVFDEQLPSLPSLPSLSFIQT